MKTEPNSLVTPLMDVKQDIIIDGLTKREYFASLIMQGMVAMYGLQYNKGGEHAKEAVKMADELINQLNANQP